MRWVKKLSTGGELSKLLLGRFGKSAHISVISNSVTHLWSYTNSAIPNISGNPSGICLPRTELLQSLFRMEFSMGSLLRRYRRSLRHHCQFLWSYRQSLRNYFRSLRRLAATRRRCRSLRDSLNIVKLHEIHDTMF